MDPAGIREVLLVRPYINNPYQFEPIIRGLPYKVRPRPHYSSIPWLPLSEPLTQRVSNLSEGFAGFGQYDCLILAGSDLESCTERDVQHIRAALERGLPLLLCGGAYGLGRSYRPWHDLGDSLPARIPPGMQEDCEAEVVAATDHPILRGLPNAFGDITALHPIEPTADAATVLSANGRPVLVAGERAGSRQLILAVGAADGLASDGLDTDGFYGHPFYPDLIRQALSWLLKVGLPLWLETLQLQDGPRRTEPGEHVLHLTTRQQEANPGALVRCRLYGVDEARLMSGGDAVRAALLHEESRPLAELVQAETFSFADPLPGKSSGLYDLEVSLEIDDPPCALARNAFGMAAPPVWSHWRGNAVDSRRFWLRFPDQRRTRVQVPGWECCLQDGGQWQVNVAEAAGAAATLRLRDGHGAEVARAEAAELSAAHELCLPTPPLADGAYTAELLVRDSQGKDEEFHFALQAVTPPDPDDGFQLVAHFRDDTANDDELQQRITDCLDSFGLDALSISGMKDAADFWAESRPRLDQPRARRRLRWMDAQVAARRQNLWTDFDGKLIVLATHGASATYAPTTPCVHHPDYEAAVREEITPALRYQATRPGLVTTEIIDEPHLYPANVCRCDICLGMYREKYGEDMPTWDAVRGVQTSKRWHFFEWMEDYTTRAFVATQKIKREIAPHLHLHNVAIDRLFTSDFKFNGMHRWAAYGDELYMACYPWSYYNYRGRDQMPHSQTHWIAAWIRGLATHYDIPWGVFMEIWEHDVPNRWLPPFWCVCQFYALIAAGATRLDTFILSFGFECFGISFERLREFGFEVNKIRPFFPLLARTKRPRARMAFVNPWCQWVMDPQPHYLPPDHEGYGYYRRYALPFDNLFPNENRRMLVYELFHRCFGDLDQAPEQLMCERPLDYQAIVVTDCNFLMRDTMTKLAGYVQDGGVLILDCAPERDETGETTEFFQQLTAGPAADSGIIIPGLTYRVFRVGKGAALCFSAGLQTVYADAMESERAGIRARLEQTVERLLAELALASRWRSSHGDIDVSVRLAEGRCLAPVANTSPEPRSARVTLADLPFAPAFAVNLTDGDFVELSGQDGKVEFDVSLDGYHGALFGLFPSRPDSCDVEIDGGALAPGQELRYAVALGAASGSFLVNVQVTDSRAEVHHRLGGPLIVVDGRVEFAKRLPVNAPSGTWEVLVEEPMIGLTARQNFEVADG